MVRDAFDESDEEMKKFLQLRAWFVAILVNTYRILINIIPNS